MEPVSVVEHDDSTCVHEYNVRSGTCTFTDENGERCYRRTKSQKEPPRCSQHYRKKGIVGYYQAIEACGFTCNRLAIYDPPFHLCTKHEKGCTTLPCYFNKLPVEVLILILEYCLPTVVRPKEDPRTLNVALLEIKKLSYAAGCTVLYGQCTFHVHVDMDAIHFLRRRLDVTPEDKPGYDRNHRLDMSAASRAFGSFLRALRRIAHLEVMVTITHDPRGQEMQQEELAIYKTRSNVRKLVSLISNSQYKEKVSIRELTVVPKICDWWNREVPWLTAVFVVIEPFQLLQLNTARLDFPGLAKHCDVAFPFALEHRKLGRKLGIDARTNEIYERERSRWLKCLQSPSSDVPECPVSMERIFHKLCVMVGTFDLVTSKYVHPSMYQFGHNYLYFADLEMADMACENGDMHLLKKIRKVIACKAIRYIHATSGDLLSIGGAFSDMYATDDAEKDMYEIEKYLPRWPNCDCSDSCACSYLCDCTDDRDCPAIESTGPPKSIFPPTLAKDTPPIRRRGEYTITCKGLRVQFQNKDETISRLLMPTLLQQLKKEGIPTDF
ncbi:hypothetical protein IQ07DRAFT_660181 [Pyrenochaeta sp. DS3sAY3a]|nr:hypothetical protein IQ07DRAFT_660181 [Pyrenochaeta sp. DS3sAY3a]